MFFTIQDQVKTAYSLSMTLRAEIYTLELLR
jgi:hypothetical protein